MTGAPPLRTARAGVPAAVPHGRQPLALAVLMVVLFLTFLDNTVVSVALGSVQGDLHAGVTALQWVVSAYAITSGAANPAVSALITAKTSADNATAPSTVPAMSTRCASGSALSGRTSIPRPSAAAPKARLNQKIARQSQIPVSTPPMAGPRASASPQTAVQTPTALSRSRSSGYRWRSMDSVPGSLAAAPRPITARPAIRTGALGTMAHSTEPAQKTAAPASMTRLRPNSSPTMPNASIATRT